MTSPAARTGRGSGCRDWSACTLLRRPGRLPQRPRPPHDRAMITRYVSPSGDDRWSGTLSEPNAARNDGPLATPRAARDAVRKARGIDVARRPVPPLGRWTRRDRRTSSRRGTRGHRVLPVRHLPAGRDPAARHRRRRLRTGAGELAGNARRATRAVGRRARDALGGVEERYPARADAPARCVGRHPSATLPPGPPPAPQPVAEVRSREPDRRGLDLPGRSGGRPRVPRAPLPRGVAAAPVGEAPSRRGRDLRGLGLVHAHHPDRRHRPGAAHPAPAARADPRGHPALVLHAAPGRSEPVLRREHARRDRGTRGVVLRHGGGVAVPEAPGRFRPGIGRDPRAGLPGRPARHAAPPHRRT